MKIFYTILGIVAVVLLVVLVLKPSQVIEQRPLGATALSYTSTTTNSTYANSSRQFKTGSGVLHTIVVGGTSATVIEIKNATSTTDLSSTTLAIFAASPETSTYTFDSAFDRGLMVNFLGSFAGSYMFTWQ